MAVGFRPPVAGNMLDDRQHAAIGEPHRMGPRQRHDRLDRLGIGPAADDLMGARLRHVENRHAIGGDAGGDQVLRHQAADVAGTAERRQRVTREDFAIGLRRRILPPGIARRPEALHPATFLIDEHRCVLAADRGAEIRRQRLELLRRFAIPPEQDQAPGLCAGKEPPFAGAERGSGTTGNEGSDIGHLRSGINGDQGPRTMQSLSPAWNSALHTWLACVRESSGPRPS